MSTLRLSARSIRQEGTPRRLKPGPPNPECSCESKNVILAAFSSLAAHLGPGFRVNDTQRGKRGFANVFVSVFARGLRQSGNY